MTAAGQRPRGRLTPRTKLDRLVAYAVCFLAGVVALVVLYLGKAAFVPIALAMLLALVLSGPVEALHARGLGRTLAASLVLVVILGLAGFAAVRLWSPARDWLGELPQTVALVETKAGPAMHVVEHMVAPAGAGKHPPGGSNAEDFASSASGSLLGATPAMVVNAVTILMMAFFLLAGGAPMMARLAGTLHPHGEPMQALKVVDAVRRDVARYYATLALINFGLGVAVAAMTFILGLRNPVLWGVMAMMLNFIPYAGSAVTLAVLTLVSFASFDSVGHVLLVVASFLVIVTIEGQVAEPLLIGRRLKLSPTVVFLALWFGGWFWGIAGVVIAIPALVALKVVAEHSPGGRVLVELLSPAPPGPFQLVRRVTLRRHRPKEALRDANHLDAGGPPAPAPAGIVSPPLDTR